MNICLPIFIHVNLFLIKSNSVSNWNLTFVSFVCTFANFCCSKCVFGFCRIKSSFVFHILFSDCENLSPLFPQWWHYLFWNGKCLYLFYSKMNFKRKTFLLFSFFSMERMCELSLSSLFAVSWRKFIIRSHSSVIFRNISFESSFRFDGRRDLISVSFSTVSPCINMKYLNISGVSSLSLNFLHFLFTTLANAV